MINRSNTYLLHGEFSLLLKRKCQIILTEAQVTTWDTYKLRPSLEWHSQCPRIGLARSWCNDAAQMFGTPSTNSTALRDGNVPLSPLSPIWGIIANKHIIIFGWCLFSPKKHWTWTTPWIKAELAFGKFSRYTSHVVACEELHKIIASTRLVFSEDLKTQVLEIHCSGSAGLYHMDSMLQWMHNLLRLGVTLWLLPLSKGNSSASSTVRTKIDHCPRGGTHSRLQVIETSGSHFEPKKRPKHLTYFDQDQTEAATVKQFSSGSPSEQCPNSPFATSPFTSSHSHRPDYMYIHCHFLKHMKHFQLKSRASMRASISHVRARDARAFQTRARARRASISDTRARDARAKTGARARGEVREQGAQVITRAHLARTPRARTSRTSLAHVARARISSPNPK